MNGYELRNSFNISWNCFNFKRGKMIVEKFNLKDESFIYVIVNFWFKTGLETSRNYDYCSLKDWLEGIME